MTTKTLKTQHAQAEVGPGSWKLPENPVWNVPAAPEVRFGIETYGPWSIPIRVTGLAIDARGRVYGMRTAYMPREEGYNLAGRVSVRGRKRRAFTSSVLFERPDGSFCSVGVWYVVTADQPQGKV